MEQFEKIEAYLSGKLEGEMLAQFEAQLQTDAQLVEEVRLQSASHKLLQASQQTYYKAFLQDIEAKYQQEASIIPWYSRPAYQIAAVLLLLCLAAVAWFRVSSPNTTYTYADALQPYPNYLSARGGTDMDSLLQIGLEAYDKKMYPLAIESLKVFYEEAENGKQAALYLGISYLFDQKYPQAIAVFEKIPPSVNYWYTGQWYLALAYGLNGDEAKSQAIIREIATNETGLYPYQEEAVKLLKP
ncbi:MAG: hypothetical protein AAFW00_24470 [Bacteroidota bacterium]